MTDRLAEIKNTPDLSEKDIAWLIAEVERLRMWYEKGVDRERNDNETMHEMGKELKQLRVDAERWRHVREHGCSSFAIAVDDEVWMNRRMDEADAAVDAARKAT